MKMAMREIAGSNVLAGAVSGRNAMQKLLAASDLEPGAPEPIFLDFTGVDVATASFLRESVLAYRDTIRVRRSKFYPVVSNANVMIEEELQQMLEARNEAILTCKLSGKAAVRRVILLGELDPKHLQTLELVRRFGETDAGTLLREHGLKEPVTRTAWNNRLATLAGLGLVIEISRGRAKRYRSVLAEAS